jgi:hypothetical protein
MSLPLLDQIDVCENRHRNSPESIDAFEKVKHSKQAVYGRIMFLAQQRGERGVTSHEVAGALGRPLNCISGRLSELRMMGKLRKSGERRNGAAVLIEA